MLPGRRRGVALAAVLVLVIVVGVGVLAVARSGGDDDRLDVAVVGDSFARQSKDQMLGLAAERGLNMEVDAYDGSSVCVWYDRFAELSEDPPRQLALAFAGNDLQNCTNPTCDDTIGHTSCTKRPPEVVAEVYREQIDSVLADFVGTDTEIFVVMPPPVANEEFEAGAAAIRTMYRQLHEDDPSIQVIDTATTLDPEGAGYQPVLPCAEWDRVCPPSGEIVLRDPKDLIHLTTEGGERYARAVLDGLS